MPAEFLQFLLTGLTIGATYALVALGFSLIYNASHVINFAQGEFLMIGGLATVFLLKAGLPLPLAALCAIALAVLVGLALERFAIEPARDADIVTLIIITIGASIFLRGVAQLIWGKEFHALPAFSGETPIHLFGATLQPQSLWVLGASAVIVIALRLFFSRTLLGKAIIGAAHNRLAAELCGINTRFVLRMSFALSALLGAVAGVLVAPITFTAYNVGVMLGLKGFVAAVLGGLGNASGAILGGLALGVAEVMTAGYLSTDYKDAVAFVLILLVLFVLPEGLLGQRGSSRV